MVLNCLLVLRWGDKGATQLTPQLDFFQGVRKVQNVFVDCRYTPNTR
ncbi:hypothetical protein PQR66_38635 [Paraburkholderia agricolaris]|uniref:Uncharacterized protein n=1 Tax=Paraburkholderia agricolaris TaxID=2152888 RepID=A0ABW9A1G6_9BURK